MKVNGGVVLGGGRSIDPDGPDRAGFQAWAYDPQLIIAGTVLPANGTVYGVRLHTPVPLTVTNLYIYVITAGATLTAGQNFAALYDSSKTLLGATADMSTSWNSIGLKTMALVGGPDLVPAGDFFVAFYANGTTRPSVARICNNSPSCNGILTAANARWFSANTGRTTAPPDPLGAFALNNYSWWAAVS